MPFAQLVVGPPGSGKSTYCDGMQQFLGAIGRKASVVNLDPANDATRYTSAVDIRTLVAAEEIMESSEMGLGPNGAVLYALETLEANFDWLAEQLAALGEDYVLFDCPGQVELFTHHNALRNVIMRIQKLGYRLVVLHLTDSYTLTQPSLYIATLLLSLRSMLQIELPTINVLTKIDNLASYDRLPFPLAFYTEVQDLSYLLPQLEAESAGFSAKFSALNAAIVQLVDDFGLIGFETLAVEDRRSMMTLLQAVDRAGGYAFGGPEGTGDGVWQTAMREGYRGLEAHEVQERWIERKDEFDELERRREEEGRRLREAGWTGGEGEGQRQGDRSPRTHGEVPKGEAPPIDASEGEDEEDGDEDEEARALAEFRSKGGNPGVQVIRKE